MDEIRILLIDDDEVANFLAERLFKLYNNNLVPTVCRNGKEAVEYLETSKIVPDLILLDINMPLMDGFEFLAWQSQSPFKEINVVMLSTSKTEEDVSRTEPYKQVIAYVEKPLDIDQIRLLLHPLSS